MQGAPLLKLLVRPFWYEAYSLLEAMFFQALNENVAAYDLTSIPGYSHAAVTFWIEFQVK